LGDDLTVDVAKLKEGERDRVLARRLHAQRGVAGFLPKHLVKTLPNGGSEEVDLVYKLFNVIALRYVERVKAGKGGGYTRIIKKANRRGDNAPVSIIELV
jgi:ribosomal protein L17